MAGKPAHYRGEYHMRSMHIRQAANSDPGTTCWRCGLTLMAHSPHLNGRPAYWTAGHIVDSDPSSPLAPEASTCNFAAGGRRRHRDKSPNAW